MPDTGTYAATGAAIGTAIPVIGTVLGGAAGAIVDLVSKLGFKGKTQHPNWNESNLIATKFNDALWATLRELNISLNSNFNADLANWIDRSGWWKVGNDQESGVPAGIRSDPNPVGATWRLAMWGIHNSPSDRLSDGWSAIKEGLDNTLPSYAGTSKDELMKIVDAYLESLRDNKAFSMPSLNNTSSGSFSSVIEKFFGGGSSSQSSESSQDVKTASIFSFSNIMILAIGFGIIYSLLFFLKGGKISAA